MATLQELEKLARKIVGHDVQVVRGKRPETDGMTIYVEDPDSLWPRLPVGVQDDIGRVVTAHEANHIAIFGEEGKKQGKSDGITAEEFYQSYADPLAPGVDSRDYVRFMLNVVEDRLVDGRSAKFVGQDRIARVNRFFTWNRQGGRRPSIAELEASGNAGMCAAFVEALFQLDTYGELVEAFYSSALEKAAGKAVRAIELFGQGALSRTQALQKVLDALRTYCPPPWSMPPEYQPPKGQNPSKGDGSGNSRGSGTGQDQGEGDSGESQNPGEGDGDSDESQSQGEGKSAKPSKNSKSKKNAQGEGNEADAEGEEGEKGDQKDAADKSGKAGQPKDKGEEFSESDGSGQGNPEGSQSRGSGTGSGVNPQTVAPHEPERRFEDNNLEALLKMLERVLTERFREAGRGLPHFSVWSPGDQISAPDELQRWWEDETFDIDPLQRRAVRRRDREKHLLALFIDSSGSVGNDLFAMLYKVCAEIADKVAELQGCYLGVGQFSGGASWVMEPTRDVNQMREFAENPAVRLYSGSTVVGEIYGLLPEWFAGYETADLVVVTDGYVEDGKTLARSLEKAHGETGCEIKLHGVIFRKKGSIKQFERAKDEMYQFVRIWHLGE